VGPAGPAGPAARRRPTSPAARPAPPPAAARHALYRAPRHAGPDPQKAHHHVNVGAFTLFFADDLDARQRAGYQVGAGALSPPPPHRPEPAVTRPPLSPGQIESAAALARGIAALDAAVDLDTILDSEDADLIGDDDYSALRAHARSLGFDLENSEDGDIFAVDTEGDGEE